MSRNLPRPDRPGSPAPLHPDDLPVGEHLLLRICFELKQWVKAVDFECERLQAGESWGTDGPLFAFALRQLYRTAELAARVTKDPSVTEAIAAFDAAIPNAINLRDVLDHSDDYLLGIGKLQHPNTKPRDRRPENALDPWAGKRPRRTPPGHFGFSAGRA